MSLWWPVRGLTTLGHIAHTDSSSALVLRTMPSDREGDVVPVPGASVCSSTISIHSNSSHLDDALGSDNNRAINTKTYPLGSSDSKVFAALAPNGCILPFPSSLLELPSKAPRRPLPIYEGEQPQSAQATARAQTPQRKRKKDVAISSPMPITLSAKRVRYG